MSNLQKIPLSSHKKNQKRISKKRLNKENLDILHFNIKIKDEEETQNSRKNHFFQNFEKNPKSQKNEIFVKNEIFQEKVQKMNTTCSTLCSTRRLKNENQVVVSEIVKDRKSLNSNRFKNALNNSLQEFFFVDDFDDESSFFCEN